MQAWPQSIKCAALVNQVPAHAVQCDTGFAAGCAAWYPLMLQLREEWAQRQSSTGLQVLVLDNIGIGRSSCPADPKLYTTTAMAYDALAVAVSQAPGSVGLQGCVHASPAW